MSCARCLVNCLGKRILIVTDGNRNLFATCLRRKHKVARRKRDSNPLTETTACHWLLRLELPTHRHTAGVSCNRQVSPTLSDIRMPILLPGTSSPSTWGQCNLWQSGAEQTRSTEIRRGLPGVGPEMPSLSGHERGQLLWRRDLSPMMYL